MEMPPIEPDKPEELEELNDEPDTPQVAPPSLVDLPTTVPVDAFTQPLSPPLPPGIEVGKNVITIPVGRPGGGSGHGMKNLFDINSLDQRPSPYTTIPPDYPYEMRRYNLAGQVTVEYIIDTRGDVVAVRVIGSSNPGFEVAALRAVQRWKFKPGRKGGRVVNTRVQQTIAFNMERE